MKNLKTLFFIITAILLVTCKKTAPDNDVNSIEASIKGDGVFIVNEGNFLKGNGSLSFYSYDSSKIFNNIFTLANGRSLGDVPNSMSISGNKGYIVVNNSGKIEVVDKNTMQSLKTIDSLISPRQILLINNEKAYISSIYSNSLTIINLQTNTVTGFVNIRHSSEAMVLLGTKAYVSSWYSGKEIIVLNTSTDKVIDSIEVAPEPESMVIDKNNNLWVLCSGGYTGDILAELIEVNTSTDEIDKQLIFPSKSSYPSCLRINMNRDTVYYIDNSIWRMSIGSSGLPETPFKPSDGRSIYKLGVDPRNGRIFYTDAVDYTQKGYVLQLNPNGKLIDSCQADIIPGTFCFK
jgi:YVTN family beta-propeller protein